MNLGNVGGYHDGKFIITKPVQPANDVNIFGTDSLGRDIFSQIIEGSRITLKIALLITLFRFIIALPFAFFAGFGGRISSAIIKFFTVAFSAIPALFFSYIVLGLSSLREFELAQSITVFIIVLTFVGWGSLASVLKDRVKDILNQSFIQGEIAIGKSKFSIAMENVLPHLTASVVVYAFLEIGKALLILAGLGVFGVYVGKNKIHPDTIRYMDLSIVPSYYPEWGGMLGTARYSITLSKPWVAIYPALAFFISIMGFNLLGEGLKHEINKRNSMIITWIKRFAFHLSPKTYLYELKRVGKYKKQVLLKTSVIALILITIFLPEPKSLYELNSEEVFMHIEELSHDKYEGRMVGTEGRDNATEYILDKLKAYNIEPLFEDEYIQEFNIPSNLVKVKESDLIIRDKDGTDLFEFDYWNDYRVSKVFEDQGISGEILTEEQFINNDYDRNKKHFLLLDNNSTREGNFIMMASLMSHIRGVIRPIENKEYFSIKSSFITIDNLDNFTNNQENYYNGAIFSPFTISVNVETANKIREHKGKDIILNSKVEVLSDKYGKNIGGIIRGSDSDSKEKIIIVTNYDYLGYEGEEKYKGLFYNGTSVAANLEIARTLSSISDKPNKDIIFLFMDYSIEGSQGAKNYVSSYFKEIDKDTFIISNNSLGLRESNKMYIDKSLINSNKEGYFQYVRYIRSRSEELGVHLYEENIINETDDIVKFRGLQSSGILMKSVNNQEYEEYYGTKQENLELIDKDLLKNQSQLILDTLLEIAY